MRRRLFAAVVAGILWLSAGRASAQSIRGTVVDNTDRALSGIVVILLDPAAKEVARAMSNDRGDYRLVAPAAGTYRVRTMRIGYRPVLTEPVDLTAGAEVVRRLVLSGVAFALDTVRAVGRNACRVVARDSTSTIFAVWEQVRNALMATQLSLGNRTIVATTMGYTQMIEIVRNRVGAQTADIRSDYLRQPWKSLTADSLRRAGYVTTQQGDVRTYDAPGIDVLLSDEFLGDHCLRVAPGSDSVRLGIAFEPTSDRSKIAEIKGTLWLDRVSAELRRLEYRYVNVSHDEERSSGGEMSFVRMKNGMWAISRWDIRMPTIVLVPVYERLTIVSHEQRVDSIKVTGGELVTAVAASNPRDTLWSRPPVVLSGILLDSLTGDRIANALVSIPASKQSDSTDRNGRFAIGNMLPGRYLLDVTTPSLDSAGMVHQVPVVFTDSSTAIRVRVPDAVTIGRGLCPAEKFGDRDGRGVILGSVMVSGDSVARPNVIVGARWTIYTAKDISSSAIQQPSPARVSATDRKEIFSEPRKIETRTDATGTYRLCGVPTKTELTIDAVVDTATLSFRKVRLRDGQRFGRLDFTIDPAMAAAVAATTPAPVKAMATFGGTVTDTAGKLLLDVDISLPELGLATRTDARGAFRIDSLIAGTHKVIARRVGYGALETTLDFAGGATVDRKIVLTRLTILDSVLTLGNSVRDPLMESFAEHKRLGLGHFVTYEEIKRREGGALVSSMLQQMPRLQLTTVNGMEFIEGKLPSPSACTGVGGKPPRGVTRDSPLGRCLMREGIYYVPGPGDDRMPGTACYARIYLDHQLMNPGSPSPGFNLRDLPPLTSIEAMEWFGGAAQVPAEYMARNSSCGVLVLHTRRFRPKEPPKSTFTGIIADATGNPIVDAEVALPDLGLTAHTDRRGRFKVEGVVEGMTKVIARRVGFNAIETSIEFVAGKNLERQFVLTRTP